MSDAVVMRVIKTTLSTRGDGTVGNPIRTITEYWSEDGERLAEVDSMAIAIRPGDPLWAQLAEERGFPS